MAHDVELRSALKGACLHVPLHIWAAHYILRD
jgi:hypothetical protein